MRHTDRPHQVPGYQIHEVGTPDKLTLSHPARGNILYVSPHTALIWGLCDGQRTVGDIIALLQEAYSGVDGKSNVIPGTVEGTNIGADVGQVLDELAEHGTVELRATQGYDIPILVYLKVAETPPSNNSVWISKRLFAEQMAALSAHGYVAVSFQDYLAYRHGVATPPPRPVILTFDDGYESLYTIVRPILKGYDFTATVFLVTKYIGTHERLDNHWDIPEARYGAKMLLWSEVEALAAGGIAFGSHTQSHRYLTAIDETLAKQEIEASALELEAHLGARPIAFSYPFGDGAGIPRIEVLVQNAGYAVAVSTLPGIANTLTSGIWAIPRIKITGASMLTPDMFLTKLNRERT
jgi:peptidoglycan/xylan/chitin deacetylase (PgdA/CDA1 family)